MQIGNAARFLGASALALLIGAVPDGAAARIIGGGYLSDFQNCQFRGPNTLNQVTVAYSHYRDDPNDDFGGFMNFFLPFDMVEGFKLPRGWDDQFGVWVEVEQVIGVNEYAYIYRPDVLPQVRVTLAQTASVFAGEEAFLVQIEIQNVNGEPGCNGRGEFWVMDLDP